MSRLEQFLGIYIDTLWKEGGRYARLRAYALLLEGMKGMRKISLAFFLSFALGMLFTAATFSILIHALAAIERGEGFPLDFFFWTCATIALGCAILFGYFLREKHWLQAFGLDTRIERLMYEQPPAPPAPSNVSEERIRDIIREILAERAPRKAPSARSPSSMRRSTPSDA